MPFDGIRNLLSRNGDDGPFDRVILKGADGKESTLSRGEFEKLPLDRRVRSLIEGARFFRAGQEIPAREALRKS